MRVTASELDTFEYDGSFEGNEFRLGIDNLIGGHYGYHLRGTVDFFGLGSVAVACGHIRLCFSKAKHHHTADIWSIVHGLGHSWALIHGAIC